jgi:hypothetical protein
MREWPGVQMILHGVRIAGSWSFWYEAQVKCGGFDVRDRVCIKELDEKFARNDSSLGYAHSWEDIRLKD